MKFTKQAIREGNFFNQTLFVTQHANGFSTTYRGRVLGCDVSRVNAAKRSLAYLAEMGQHPKEIMTSFLNGKNEVTHA